MRVKGRGSGGANLNKRKGMRNEYKQTRGWEECERGDRHGAEGNGAASERMIWETGSAR